MTANSTPKTGTLREPQTYTPGKVAHHLSVWPELLEMAGPGPQGSGRFSPVPSGSAPTDPYHVVTIIVDVERAWLTLRRWSIEAQIVEWSMRRPIQVEHKDYMVAIADALRVSVGTANGAFYAACRKMAAALGWREEGE